MTLNPETHMWGFEVWLCQGAASPCLISHAAMRPSKGFPRNPNDSNQVLCIISPQYPKEALLVDSDSLDCCCVEKEVGGFDGLRSARSPLLRKIIDFRSQGTVIGC